MGRTRHIRYTKTFALLASLGLVELGPAPCRGQTTALGSDAAEATLSLAVSEGGTLVSIDGLARGVTPLEGGLRLAPGHHHLELFKAGFERIALDLELVPGPQALSFELQAGARLGRLSVGASSLPADLLLDGKNMGALPWSGDVAAGEHRVAARGPNAASSESQVTLQAGQTTIVSLTMQPRQARLEISVRDASIYIDDKWVAVGRWEAAVPAGRHHIRLKRIGLPAKEYDVTLAADETWTISNITWDTSLSLPPEERDAPSWAGLYGQLGLFGLFSKTPTDELKQDCPATAQGGRCKWNPSYGGGLGVRVGYSFGWLAAEAVALGVADAWYDKAHYQVAMTAEDSAFYGPARTERYTFARYGAALGLGVRVTTPTEHVRATLGLSLGALQRWQRYFRIASTVTQITTPTGTMSVPDATMDASEVDSSTSPFLLGDIGVLFGSTPGLKLHLGLLVAASLGGTSEVGPRSGALGRNPLTGARGAFGSGAIDISRGGQLFFGPILGVQLGH